MKIKPDNIAIPCDDPFKHDQLNRRSIITNLTNLLQNVESPYTMSIDASWGNGKTTFLNMWKQHLKNEGFPVVSFNAWETDFAGTPFVALASELLLSLNLLEESPALNLKTLKNSMQNLSEIFRATDSAQLLSLGGAILSAQQNDPVFGIIGTALAWFTSILTKTGFRTKRQNSPQHPATYQDAKTGIGLFKSELRDVAKLLSCKHAHKPLIIAIDELDRCRPSYAVELLEIAKHFFSVNNVVFVLAIDKTQLAHAISAIYGSDFDTNGYLRRFIDLNFRLPDPDRTRLINHIMRSTGINTFARKNPRLPFSRAPEILDILKIFFNLPTLSIRHVQQSLHHLGLVFTSLDTPTYMSYGAITLLTILKTFGPEIYQRFVKADITDQEVSEYLFSLPGLQNFKNTEKGAILEALLIMGYGEFASLNNKPITTGPSLFHRYFHIIEQLPDFPSHDTTKENNLSPPLSDREKQILHHMTSPQNILIEIQKGTQVGFNLTAQRLELFSSDLIGNT